MLLPAGNAGPEHNVPCRGLPCPQGGMQASPRRPRHWRPMNVYAVSAVLYCIQYCVPLRNSSRDVVDCDRSAAFLNEVEAVQTVRFAPAFAAFTAELHFTDQNDVCKREAFSFTSMQSSAWPPIRRRCVVPSSRFAARRTSVGARGKRPRAARPSFGTRNLSSGLRRLSWSQW